MIKKKTYNSKSYVLTNDGDLKKGDKVFPIMYGTSWNFNETRSGFPYEPHIVESVKKGIVYTDCGHGERECYFTMLSAPKHISELKQSELFDKIFAPIFKMKLDFEEHRDYKMILDEGKGKPYIFIPHIYKDIDKEIDQAIETFKKEQPAEYYRDIYTSVWNVRDKILKEHDMVRSFSMPYFSVNFTDTYIGVYLDYVLTERCYNSGLDSFKEDCNKHYIKFYDNSDIEISEYLSKEFRTSFFSKATSSYCTQESRMLSYTETIAMRKYFDDINVIIDKEFGIMTYKPKK